MALHPELPRSPYALLHPAHRWFPADEALRASSYERLLPPLVARIREQVNAWRDSGYAGASETSKALLRWWFDKDHVVQRADGTAEPFRWYFAQREAVESVIWLYDVREARDKFDLLRFDASGAVSPGMFPEDWPRYVVKMATGAGKTKVLSLLIAWSFFHRLYEPGSQLSRNFLLIAPNIIVLDRLRADFDGLRIFFKDPILPDNGHDGRNWRDDFQLTLHLQDDVRVVRPFRTQHRDWLPAKRSLFNRIVGEPGAGGFELRFARFLDEAPGVAAFAKNYLALGFKLDYVKTDGDLSTYTPDFIVKDERSDIWIVETKGREELDLPRKMARLEQWCADATAASRAQGGPAYQFIYVDQDGFDRHPPTSLAELATMFREYQLDVDGFIRTLEEIRAEGRSEQPRDPFAQG